MSNIKYRYDIDALMNQRITFRDQMTGKIRQVPISAVAEAELSSTFSAVKRRDLNRLINISSNLIEGYNANEIVAEMKKAMEAYDLPEGNRMKFTGQQEEQAKQAAVQAEEDAKRAAEEAAEAKTDFKVTLKEAGSEKIKVIKALRSVTSLALKEAKDVKQPLQTTIKIYADGKLIKKFHRQYSTGVHGRENEILQLSMAVQ